MSEHPPPPHPVSPPTSAPPYPGAAPPATAAAPAGAAPTLELPRFIKPGLLMLGVGLVFAVIAGLAMDSRKPPVALVALAGALTAGGRALVGAGLLIWGIDRDRDPRDWRAVAAILAGAVLLALLSVG